ncbi:MAG: hypothetical protein HKN57_02550 [Xanthomonadales bacterium]|nr:DsrE family protein [Gammaproteobacteria bacterium]MBT8054516.1 DsrE family protein [Gammaproteobacteria bacterium]NND56107.1 hypothetical protein [Xanthomonadales bacterium]NNK52598.1 hypothetical protein [Xanthomonadales bacterium]
MKILIIVNESPWGTSLGVTAFRLVRAMVANEARVAAVFFRGDGVYHAQTDGRTDSGTPCLAKEWRALSRQADIPLLLCSAAAQRRLENVSSAGFREAGLAEVMAIMADSDRVVTF